MELAQALTRDDLVKELRIFDSTPVINRYREPYKGKSPAEILAGSADHKILRAFHYENPKQQWEQWRWHDRAALLLQRLDAMEDQNEFDRFIEELGESLVADWRETNEFGSLSKMNIGISMKIVNVALKHLAFNSPIHNGSIVNWLHVPWDNFTLKHLRQIWQGYPSITKSTTMGFVKNLATYRELHSLVSSIAQEAGVSRIIYEFWAWDKEQQDKANGSKGQNINNVKQRDNSTCIHKRSPRKSAFYNAALPPQDNRQSKPTRYTEEYHLADCDPIVKDTYRRMKDTVLDICPGVLFRAVQSYVGVHDTKRKIMNLYPRRRRKYLKIVIPIPWDEFQGVFALKYHTPGSYNPNRTETQINIKDEENWGEIRKVIEYLVKTHRER